MKKLLNKSLIITVGAFIMLLPITGCALIGKLTSAGKSDIPTAWWSNFARFTNNTTTQGALDVSADAMTAVVGLHDEGIGEYARQWWYDTKGGKTNLELAKTSNIKALSWIEFSGESRSFVLALNNLGNGKYETDSNYSGAAKLTSNYWDWDRTGPGLNSSANNVVWAGIQSWINKESWCGNFVMPSDFLEPKYPDGQSAVGKLKADSADPRDYKCFDALVGKSVFGTFVEQEQFETPKYRNLKGFIYDPLLTGKDRTLGDYYFSRDISSDWWLEYNKAAVQSFLKDGVNGFWVDNYTGWGYISAYPIQRAFGDWSVAGFRDYLKKHPINGVSSEKFDIKTYIVDKVKKEYPQLDTTSITLNTFNYFKDSAWLDDPVWLSFLAYKSEVVSDQEKKFYEMVKAEAKKLGKNPNDIVVSGNDVAMMQNGTMSTGEYLDIVNAEYNPDYSGVTQNYTDKMPPQGYAGPMYKLVTQLSKSKRGAIWYYLMNDKKDKETLAKMISFEALANNCTINSGSDIPTVVGNNDSAWFVNNVIGQIRNDFGKRDITSSIALFNSGSSEYCQLMPGGYINNGAIPSTMSYLGWGSVLENLKLPYKTITEQKITLDALKDTNVLIMANINAVSKDTVENILKPYLDNGNAIVITGKNAGERGLRDTQYAKYSEPLLTKLATEYKGKGKIIYLENDPTVDSYKNKNNTSAFDKTVENVKEVFNGLSQSGIYKKDLKLSGFGEDILVSLNQDVSNKAFYVDLVNRSIDVEKDKMISNKTGKISVKVPSWMKNKTVKVKIFSIGKNAPDLVPVETKAKVKDGYVSLDIPEFVYYSSVIIKA